MIIKCNFEDKAEKSFSIDEIYKFLTDADIDIDEEKALNTEAIQHIIAWLPMIAEIEINCYFSFSNDINIVFQNGERINNIYNVGIESALCSMLPDIEII